MRYTVVWDSALEAQFIEAWIASNSKERGTLTEIANWIDKNLSTDPDHKGQARKDINVQILAIPISESHTSVVYQVLPEDRQVRVIRLIIPQ